MQLIKGLGGASGFGENFLARNDDGSTDAIDLKAIFGEQGLSIGGKAYTSAYVNNNGTVSFGAKFAGYDEAAAIEADDLPPLLAILLSDVDTTGVVTPVDGPDAVDASDGGTSTGSNLVWYDQIKSGDGVLTVTWDDVGYYNAHTDKQDAYQLRIIGRGEGNFTIEFRYETITWAAPTAAAGVFLGALEEFLHVPGTYDQAGLLSLDTMIGNTGKAGLWRWNSISGTSAQDTVTGTGSADMLWGGTGNDTLNGRGGDDYLDGGAGKDTMRGGVGNDTYILSQRDDIVIELANGGSDTIQAAFSFALRNVDNVENLQLAGIAKLNGYGTRGDNILAGNDNDNRLYGLFGDDILIGDGGNDVLNGGAGQDILLGGGGNDLLNGWLGADTLTGGAGVDRFVFSTALSDAAADTITDFISQSDSSGADKDRIFLDDDIFTALDGPGALAEHRFVVGTQAGDASDRLIYDDTTGNLYYDADGTGAQDQVLVAHFTGTTVEDSEDLVFPVLTAGDFLVIS